jgi:hypothetical protein
MLAIRTTSRNAPPAQPTKAMGIRFIGLDVPSRDDA